MLKQYKDAIEKSNIISKTDVAGIITFVNDEFCKISGYTRSELLGQNHNIIRHPDVPESTFKLLWETIKSKQTYKNTAKNLAKDGSVFYVNTTIIPILDKDENIVEFVAIRYDVTREVFYKEELLRREVELKELNATLEKRVQEKTKELEKLNATLHSKVKKEIAKNEEKRQVMFWQSRLASLGEMLANIAHQWRQPLTELNLTVFSIKKAAFNDDKDEVQKLYGESKNIIQNMSKTIDDFTNFFKPDKDKESFNVSDSVREAIRLLEKLITTEMISIKTDLPEMKVLGISNELTQVIINLIKNSSDAFVQNSILIREINITVKEEDGYALIELQDNAGGIKQKNAYKVFEPYFTTKHTSQGTGLGLFMSKMICEKGMHGSLDVKSKKNITTFSIRIPIENSSD
ncbi:MAG: PAS domain-containing sensor histidine kinase [Sulfurimonas sp.]|nr:PAS domain-containing sensor histidine kinase [Sulfurimonas sp.]